MKTQSSFMYLRLRAGFSLVETLLATGIISTAALGTLGLLAGSMSASQDGSQRSKALVVAEDLFHDLQLGALKLAPAATDERQTSVLRPTVGFDIPRTVLIFDSAGIPLPISDQPGTGKHEMIYESGSRVARAAWLAVIEGKENPAFSADATEESIATGGNYKGSGQVITLPDPLTTAPLGTAQYDFPAVSSPSVPTEAPPRTGLTQVMISLEYPPSAPAKARKKYRYHFLWNR